jgi:hypothetical protein
MIDRIAPPTVLATPGGPTLVKGAQLMKSVPQTPKRAVLYARVSTDEQDKKYGCTYRRLQLIQRTSPARLGHRQPC